MIIIYAYPAIRLLIHPSDFTSVQPSTQGSLKSLFRPFEGLPINFGGHSTPLKPIDGQTYGRKISPIFYKTRRPFLGRCPASTY